MVLRCSKPVKKFRDVTKRVKFGFHFFRLRSQGFTLLETLLVLTLLAGAGMTLLVKLPLQFEERNLSLAGTQLVQELRDARQIAMTENTFYEVRFYRSQNIYKVYKEGLTVVSSVTLPEKVTFLNSPSIIRFTASGMPVFAGSYHLTGTISLTNGKAQRNVVVALNTGRVRIENK